MKKLCRNCGAKVPKKSDNCPKCGEPYEYIDLVSVDPETEKILHVEKPSVMFNVCILILSILVLCYSCVLIYFKYTGDDKKESDVFTDTSAVAEDSVPEEEPAESSLNFNATDFIGLPFSEAKKVLGDKYSIKISDTTLVAYTDIPVTLSTLDSELTDDSIISKVIVSGDVQVSAVVNASMTFDELKMVLSLKTNAPELNEEDAYYYVHETLENSLCQISADFRFDDEATDKAPIEVTLTDISLNIPKVMGTVSGLDDFLNLRSEPSGSADALAELVNGDEVEIIDTLEVEGTQWYQVIYKDSITGFAVSEFIVTNDKIKNNSMFDSSDSETEESEDSESEDSDDSSDDE